MATKIDGEPDEDAPKDDDAGDAGDNDTGGTDDDDGSDDGDEDPKDEAKLPAWAQKERAQLRRENAKHRNAAKGAEEAARKKLLEALGVGTDKDPEEVARDLEKERSAAREAKVELTVVRRAGKLNADADALLDSRSFLRSVADLDPADEDFSSQVDAAIRAAVKENSRLGSQVGRQGRGGGDFGGSGSGSNGSTKEGPKSVEDAYKLVTGRK